MDEKRKVSAIGDGIRLHVLSGGVGSGTEEFPNVYRQHVEWCGLTDKCWCAATETWTWATQW